MPMEPIYPGTQLELKKTAKIIEDYIKDNWTFSGVDADKIGFGKWGSQMMKGKGNKITLKVYPASDKSIKIIDVGSFLWQHEQLFTIDLWMRSVRINAREDDNTLFQIATYVENFFAENPTRMRSLGISEVVPEVSQSVPDEASEDTQHEVIDLYVKYLKKRVI